MRNLLVGDNVKLTAIKEIDLSVMEEWFNDVEFMRHYDMIPAIPQASSDVQRGIEFFKNTNERYIFAIRTKDSNEILGVAGFNDIIWSNGTSIVFIGIGNKNYRNKGIGKESLNLLLDFGFSELNLHKFQLNVLAYNNAAIRLYESVGFIREGCYREYILRDGNRYDMYLYGLLKKEYKTIQ